VIPHVFHQIWLGPDPFPKEFRDYQRSWLRHNPGWELHLWTEDDLPGDLRRVEAYERLRQPAERSDILRLELLHRQGGIYLDADFECLRPIGPALEGVDFFCAYLKPDRVNNAIIGSIPGHPLLERAIAEVRPRDSYGPVDKEGTGPFFLNRLVADAEGVTIFDAELFYPRTPETRARAIAVHHSARSWKAPELLLKDAQRAEEKLGRAQDELSDLRRRYEAAQAEIEALRAQARGDRAARLRAWRARFSRLRP
jgi:inositol phosphorylceramide mannosyltransferase catalytic subunit